MPKISVIIPIYGVEKYLKEAIDSVLNQTLKDIEIILIDDGSKDGCPQIIDEYAKQDSRIVAIHKENGGYGQTCNVGLEKACGDYVAILEPDDYIDPNMYEDLYNLAAENNCDIVKSSFYENVDTSSIKKICEIYWNRKHELPKGIFNIRECPLFLYFHPSVWSCIYKREFLNKNNIKFVEAPGSGWTDNPFQVQTMCLAQRIMYTSKPYYYWRILNIDESKDLKDITIPLKRSTEIHNWLIENNINDKNILACLYKRELMYIDLILSASKYNNRKIAYEVSKQILNLIDGDIIENNEYITRRDKKIYKQLTKRIVYRFFYLKYKAFMKSIGV